MKALQRISSSLLNHYKKLLMIRRANPEIARGDYEALQLRDTKLGGFVSTWEGRSVLVLHNTTARPLKVDLAGIGLERFARIVGAPGRGRATLDGTVLVLEGQTSAVLREEGR